MPRIISADLRFALTHIGRRDVYPSVRRGLGRTIAQAIQSRIPSGQIPQVLRVLADPLASHEIFSHLAVEERGKPLLSAADALDRFTRLLIGLRHRRNELREELRIARENASASIMEMSRVVDLHEKLLTGLEYPLDTPLEDVFSHRKMLKAKLAELDEGCRKLEAELRYTNERAAATREELMSLLQTARAERDEALAEILLAEAYREDAEFDCEKISGTISGLRAEAMESRSLKKQIEDLNNRIRELEEQRTQLEQEKREEAKGRTDAEARLLEKTGGLEKNKEEITRLRAEKAGLEVQLEGHKKVQMRLSEIAFALGPNISADIDAILEAIRVLKDERISAISRNESGRRVVLADVIRMREEIRQAKEGLIEGLKAAGIIAEGMSDLALLELVRRVNVGINNMARANEALRDTLLAKGENEKRLTGRVDELFRDLQRVQNEIEALNTALGYPKDRDIAKTTVAVTAELETLKRQLQRAEAHARRADDERETARRGLIRGAVVLSAQGAEIERLREAASNALKWQDRVLEIRRLDGVQTGSLLERDYAIFTDSPKGTKNSHLAIHARIIVGEGQIASLYCIAEDSASWPAVKSYIKYRLAGRPMVDAARDSKLFGAENQTGIIIAEHDERKVVIIHQGRTQAMVVDSDPKVETLAFSTQGKRGAVVVSIPIARDESENMPALLLSSGALLGNPALEQRVIIAVQNPDDPSHITARKIIAEAREIGVLDPISLALLTLGVKFDATNITSRTL